MKGRIKKWLTPEEAEWLDDLRYERNRQRQDERQKALPRCVYSDYGYGKCERPAKKGNYCGIHFRMVERDREELTPESFQKFYGVSP